MKSYPKKKKRNFYLIPAAIFSLGLILDAANTGTYYSFKILRCGYDIHVSTTPGSPTNKLQLSAGSIPVRYAKLMAQRFQFSCSLRSALVARF